MHFCKFISEWLKYQQVGYAQWTLTWYMLIAVSFTTATDRTNTQKELSHKTLYLWNRLERGNRLCKLRTQNCFFLLPLSRYRRTFELKYLNVHDSSRRRQMHPKNFQNWSLAQIRAIKPLKIAEGGKNVKVCSKCSQVVWEPFLDRKIWMLKMLEWFDQIHWGNFLETPSLHSETMVLTLSISPRFVVSCSFSGSPCQSSAANASENVFLRDLLKPSLATAQSHRASPFEELLPSKQSSLVCSLQLSIHYTVEFL